MKKREFILEMIYNWKKITQIKDPMGYIIDVLEINFPKEIPSKEKIKKFLIETKKYTKNLIILKIKSFFGEKKILIRVTCQ